jgi:C4-type Zn-finger protein
VADARECPLCATAMRLNIKRTSDRVPGTNEIKVREDAEWICPECDHFEEAELDNRRED